MFNNKDSRSNSPDLIDQDDSINRNIQELKDRDDDNLETIERKFSIIRANTDNILSDYRTVNGNIVDDIDEVLRQNRSISRDPLDSAEDAPNDSLTDDEEHNGDSLRRRRLVLLFFIFSIGN